MDKAMTVNIEFVLLVAVFDIGEIIYCTSPARLSVCLITTRFLSKIKFFFSA